MFSIAFTFLDRSAPGLAAGEISTVKTDTDHRVAVEFVHTLHASARRAGQGHASHEVADLIIDTLVGDHTQRHVGQAITTAKLVSASKVF